MKRIPFHRLAPVAAAAALALLAACGGGGEDAGAPLGAVSELQAESMSANSAVLPADSVEGQATVLSTTRAVVAGGTASQTFACAGGGTAVFTVTGGSIGSVTNGQLDAGEVYSLTYTDCRGAAGAAALTGTTTLTVVTAAAGSTEVNTSTQNLQIALPLRTLTLNGSSTLSELVADNGAGVVTTTHRWTSPNITVNSLRNTRTSTFTLSNVDQTRVITTTGGTISARTRSGTVTMNAQLPNGSWTITTATQGAVSFDANGVPTQGSWTITLPNNIIGISVVPGTLTVTADWGANGTIDRTWTFTSADIGAEAG
ncbi:MAG: hypothetical protein AB7U92_01830 [Piscinibacter sp.]|uniref:hypothetical protein n=1 Tax=Piscinibacter sp. TaxID=1903157 RepID=UPI003D1094FA